MYFSCRWEFLVPPPPPKKKTPTQNLVFFTCGFIKFILQENETLHRETVYMDLDTMLLQSWSSPSIENIIM